ncbi:MAG: hypothetical protein C0504_05035 [Candidatus Solibacter sp.]|nr:hypothetical protein [Candidatus Solibacter sp.]
MTEIIVIIASLAAVVAIVAYKYWTLGDRGAEFDLVVKRGESLCDPQDPGSTIELDLESRRSPESGGKPGSEAGS